MSKRLSACFIPLACMLSSLIMAKLKLIGVIGIGWDMVFAPIWSIAAVFLFIVLACCIEL